MGSAVSEVVRVLPGFCSGGGIGFMDVFHLSSVTLSEMLRQVTYQDLMKINQRKFGIFGESGLSSAWWQYCEYTDANFR